MSVTLGRPALRYHGGKWMLAPWIIEHFPPHRIYAEPFAGAASVLLRKDRAYAEVYNDLDGEVCNLFAVLRDEDLALALAKLLYLTPFARAEFFGAYEPTEEPLERARRTIVRSFMGFGTTTLRHSRTGFRSKGLRAGQPPQIDWVNYPEQLQYFTERLRGVVIENRPAVDLIRHQDSDETLFYVDPPYVHDTRSSIKTGSHAGTAYRHEMTDEQHVELAEVLHEASGMVVLSGYACDLYDRDLYADWERRERQVLSDGAQPRTEVLWLNPACSAALVAAPAQSRLIA